MNPAPIALFVYNRMKHTAATVTALQNNALAKETELFIFSDGSPTAAQAGLVKEVRNYLYTIKGFKKISVTERTGNYGLARNIIDGVTSIINNHHKVIVVEDDLVTSPYFLQYMNAALDRYENQTQVVCVHGYLPPVKEALPETFFLKGTDCWGWATWKRGWDLFERDGKKLLDHLLKNNLTSEFDYEGAYPFTQVLEDQIKGINNSWAIRWKASAFIKNKLTLYPGRSLVQNIGNDGTGIHSGSSTNFDTELSRSGINLTDIPVEVNAFCRSSYVTYFNSIKPALLKRLFSRLKTIAKNAILKKNNSLG
ncbi:MAG: glycosyltransferase [Ginsengibacter sp.]